MMVLMHSQQIKPLPRLLAGPKPLHLVITKRPKQPLVPDITHPKQCQLRVPLLQQDRLNGDIIRLGHSAKVVQQATRLQQIQRAKVPLSRRIIVVPMNRKHRDRDVDIRVLIINMRKRALKDRGRVGQELEGTGLHAEAVAAQGAHDLVERLAGGFVVVEEVACEEDHVDLGVSGGQTLRKRAHILGFGEAHDLVKGLPAVIFADGVALFVADVAVCSDEDADRVCLC